MRGKPIPKRSPYHVLEVSPQARTEVIRGAYVALMKLYHPQGAEPDEEYAKEILAAYEVLKDPDRRRVFDADRIKLLGKTLQEYQIKDKIAEGATGYTYKGVHLLTGMPVCIKHFLISPGLRKIALEEAAAMWDLSHCGIPSLRNIFILEDDSIALVMSYVPGETLEQWIQKKGGLNPEDVAWITDRILNVLMYLHFENGVIHGDLKPQNIIVLEEKHRVSLVDFGLALIRPKGGDLSKGYTRYFASPEEEEGKTILPESDFYSLGMVMIYALGGSIEYVKKKEVPSNTPDALCALIKRFIRRDVLSRPRWPESPGDENLCETIEKIRLEVFGRVRSGMKPISGVR